MTKDHEYLYPYSAQEAKKRNQLPMWRESYHANVACRNAIEETIRQNFDGMHLKKDCLEPVLAEYGYKRTEWVLATTLQELSWDGRFSRANKQWAARRYIPQDERHNAEITVRSWMASSTSIGKRIKSWGCLAPSIASVTVPSRITSVRCWYSAPIR